MKNNSVGTFLILKYGSVYSAYQQWVWGPTGQFSKEEVKFLQVYEYNLQENSVPMSEIN